MVTGYLMNAKSRLEKFREALVFEYNDFNYQIYIPEKEGLAGYFVDKNLNVSENRFYLSAGKGLTDKIKQKLDSNISKGKFVKKIEISDDFFTTFLFSALRFKRAKEEFQKRFTNFSNFVKS